MDLFSCCLPARLGWIVKEFRGNLRKIHLLTCNNIKEVKKDAWNANKLSMLIQEFFSPQKQNCKYRFKKIKFLIFQFSWDFEHLKQLLVWYNIMSFILSLENWEFSGYVEIIRKFLVLISVMKKNWAQT